MTGYLVPAVRNVEDLMPDHGELAPSPGTQDAAAPSAAPAGGMESLPKEIKDPPGGPNK